MSTHLRELVGCFKLETHLQKKPCSKGEPNKPGRRSGRNDERRFGGSLAAALQTLQSLKRQLQKLPEVADR
jgi:hypothetical protein